MPTREEAMDDALLFGCSSIASFWGVALCITQPEPWTAAAIVLIVLGVLSMRCWARARRFWKRPPFTRVHGPLHLMSLSMDTYPGPAGGRIVSVARSGDANAPGQEHRRR